MLRIWLALSLFVSSGCTGLEGLEPLQGQPTGLKPVRDIVAAGGAPGATASVQVLDATSSGVNGVPVRFRTANPDEVSFSAPGGGQAPEVEVLSQSGMVQGSQVDGLAEVTLVLRSPTSTVTVFASAPSLATGADASVEGSVAIAVIQVQP